MVQLNQPFKSRRGRGERSARIFTLIFLTLSLVHLALQLVDPGGVASQATQVLLMPPLAAVVLASTAGGRTRPVNLVLIALFFSWLGDTVPRWVHGDPGFLSMVAAFLVAQVFYLAAMKPWWSSSVLTRPLKALSYVAALLALVIWCAPGAGALLLPVLVYGCVLSLMAAASTGVAPRAGFGGAVFFLSDALIALHSFAGVHLPAMDFIIMLTYLAGQYLLVTAIVDRAEDSVNEAIQTRKDDR